MKTADTMPLRSSLLFGFSLPAFMLAFMQAPESMVQGIYAKHGGVPLTALAGAILLTRVLDAVTYPLIGYLCDLTAARTGSRKPWIAAGTLVTVIGLWFLFRPPPGVGAVYFGCWLMVAYIGWKLTEIPYTAWSYALSSDYAQRARIQIWRGVANLVGNIAFFAVPYAAKALGLSQSTELDFHTLSLTAVVIVLLVPLLNAWCLLRVPDGETGVALPRMRPAGGLREMWTSVAGNGPLLRLLLAYVPVGICSGMALAVTYLYFDVYLHQSEQLPLLQILSLAVTLLGLPFWGWICMRFERHRVWAVSLVLGALLYAAQSAVPPGPAALVPLLVLYPATLFVLVAIGVTVPAMTGDIVDYGKLAFGQDRAGIYAAVFAFLSKSMGGLSAAAGLAIVGAFGFDATAAAPSAAGIVGLKLVYVWIPSLALLAAAAVIWNFPLDRARLRQIHAALAATPAA
jgi:GPH family glycoside/pentoside/hexuronide:cation symporter